MKNTKNIVLSAMMLATGLVLPFITGQIKEIGNMLLPMHIPVILCGLICGWQYGLIIGFMLPIMRSILFFAPVMYPSAISMAFELATYGFVTGYLYSRSPWHCIKALYKSMLVAMLSGRVVWGIVQTLLLFMGNSVFTFRMFITSSVLNAIPGIILQLILIPAIMVALKRAKLLPIKRPIKGVTHEAKNI